MRRVAAVAALLCLGAAWADSFTPAPVLIKDPYAARVANVVDAGSGQYGLVTVPMGAQSVSGTVAVSNPTTNVWIDGGSITVTQSTAANLNATVTYGSGTFPVSGIFWQSTQPISGTVTSTQGSPPWDVRLDAGSSITAFQGGTWTVQPGNTANTTAWKTADTSGGATASAVPANAIQVGGIAAALGSAPTALTAGNLSALQIDTQGRLFVNVAHPNFFSCTVSAATTVTQCQAPPGSGSLYITDAVVNNGGTAQNVTLVSGTTVTTACDTTQANVSSQINFAVNSSVATSFITPIKVAAQKGLCCKNSGSTIFNCTISGYTAP